MASLQVTTPTHSHPLSLDEGSRSRRGRGNQPLDDRVKSPSNYFDLKAQLDSAAAAHTSHTHTSWDGSVRGYGKKDKRRSVYADRALTRSHRLFHRSVVPAPVIVVDATHDLEALVHNSNSLFPDDLPFEISPTHTAKVLGTRWHEYSDEAIQSTISRLDPANSPSNVSNNPYHDTLRVLSFAVHKLSKARAELEESRKMLLEKEAARRIRAEQLMTELQPSEQEIARRVLQSLFPDDDEGRREVQRQHSDNVRTCSVSSGQILIYR